MLTSQRKQKALWAEVVDEELGSCVKKKKKMQPETDLPSDLKNLLAKTLQGFESISSEKFQELQDLCKDPQPKIRWLALEIIGSHLKMSDVDKSRMKSHFHISPPEDLTFGLDFQSWFEKSSENLEIQPKIPKSAELLFQPPTQNLLPRRSIPIKKLRIQSELHPETDSEYIILEAHLNLMKEIAKDLISVKLAPICIYGATGTGKSTLIRLLGSLFGRHSYPSIIYVQMSDQIDSRLLLGSYHSTDLPGQFVWKPGCLTKAVLNGYWIVLEDLDSASADVLTLIDSLIDSGTLTVPGFGEIRKFHEDFRILSTVRTFGGSGGDGRLLERIGRHWRKYPLKGLDVLEMKIMLGTLFPNLKSLAEKLSRIFGVMEEAKAELGGKNRLLSLRDFLKLCRRIPQDLDLTKQTSALKIFQESLDLFVASLYNPDSRKEVATKLGAFLNILLSNVEYFCGAYKPIISIDLNARLFTAGRYTLPMLTQRQLQYQQTEKSSVFSLTKRACCLLEMISSSVHQNEPVLLLGETGVGKTSCIQFLAQTLSQKLVVVNLNRQSDSSDLLGGYKPVELKYIFGPIREEFETLFRLTFRRESNQKFLDHLMTAYANRKWGVLTQLMAHVQRTALLRQEKLKDRLDILHRWVALGHQISRIEAQLGQGQESPFAFSFIEGTLIDALRKGQWILLDEINLATPEMLQSLSGVLESQAQIHLWEKGDEAPIQRHKNFHLFAAMNPSTDVGKKDLPLGLRNRFTEYFVDELTDPDELQLLVSDYLRDMSLSSEQIRNIVKFYLTVRNKAASELVDGTGKKPHFSLRTLCRALKIAGGNLYGSVSRSLYESFCISFLTQLDYSSHPVVQKLIAMHIFGNKDLKSVINQALPRPSSGNYVCVEGYWLPKGELPEVLPEKYILTPSIRRNLKDLARIVSAGRLPVLIQGETSVGKTSLIQYLAQVSGNRCYRINNHQHTDLQEYIGSYQSNDQGKLVFTEGVLVQAMRKGEWVILDELNLAPSEVLEALNRLLDDNRELFITETGVTVTAHPRFMLFATQNPPGLYGGRKLLSRAFRNRFVELHFDEIPSPELETILHQRCAIPPSYCKKIIGVMKELQMRRKSSAALQGKHGFATLRDLFRWAERYRLSAAPETKFYDWDQHLADDGYLVLAGKVRLDSEAEIIQEVLKRHFKRTVEPESLFSLHEKTSPCTRGILESVLGGQNTEFGHVVWTFQARRLVVLIGNAMKFNEPVLLVGETGCGKTTIVQILAEILKTRLFSVNCHMHSEGSDFLGGLRPVRSRCEDDDRLFEWVDGPLVEAMSSGGIFLADEISLADDSVLERINSVLEPERTLLISEKGDQTPELIVAHAKFQFVGTMNPGGDYGKKELSPALRNRLTEIWCPNTLLPQDLISIIEHNLHPSLQNLNLGEIMTQFVSYLKSHQLCSRIVISIRDYLAWVNFANTSKNLKIPDALKHGASLVFLDGLGSGNTSVENPGLWTKAKEEALGYLQELLRQKFSEENPPEVLITSNSEVHDTKETFGIGLFSIQKAPLYLDNDFIEGGPGKGFSIEAPTTCQNGLRLLRALQLPKPILLEGSPGVGKTAIVSALAKFTNNSVLRINLSEQTDIADLFGADLPVEGEAGGHFAWRDGPLLQALKNESWILLDELNLASQSVLEGLNACLDHRGEIFVPELNRTFKIRSRFSRIFGCQNPLRQGGARKGLPKSFLNRFTQVYIDPLQLEDLNFVIRSSFPRIPANVVELMGRFSQELERKVCRESRFGSRGAPWDFNLRDLMRWAELVWKEEEERNEGIFEPELFVDLVYGMRMRCGEDRERVLELWREVKGGRGEDSVVKCGSGELLVRDGELECGTARVRRVGDGLVRKEKFRFEKLGLRKEQMAGLEGTLKCLEMGWMPILVGPSGSGKTSLMKLIAQLCGRDLQIMTPSPEMDTIELLGGFEQADIYRRLDEVTGHLRDLMLDIGRYLMAHHENPYTVLHARINKELALKFWEEWAIIQDLKHLAPQESLGQREELQRLRERVSVLEKGYVACKSLLRESGFIISEEEENNFGSAPTSSEGRKAGEMGGEEEDSDSSSATLPLRRNTGSSAYGSLGFSLGEYSTGMEVEDERRLGQEVEEDEEEEEDEDSRLRLLKPHRLTEAGERVWRELEEIHSHLTAGIQTGGFQWIHSALIKAVLTGEWLLIDGANRCTSAVLDRLNCLMEPGGSVLLSERGSIDGEIPQIRPHPNFRLILAIRPSYGEISRAMRNRGVEIFLPGPGSSERTEDRSLYLDNFLNAQWLRVWKGMRILERAQAQSQFTESGVGKNPLGILVISLLARTLPEDALCLASAVSAKFPHLSNLMRSVSEVPLKLDEMFEPVFVAKFRNVPRISVSTSQNLICSAKSTLHLHRAALHNFSIEFPRGSLGFVAQRLAEDGMNAVKEFEPFRQLLLDFWNVWRNLCAALEAMFGAGEWFFGDEMSLKEVAQVWLKGLKVLEWIQRLARIAREELSAKRNNEILIARVRLLLAWIEEDVLGTLKMILRDDPAGAKALREIKSEARVRGQSEVIKAEEILRMKSFPAKSLKLAPERENQFKIVTQMLSSVFKIWSCNSAIPKEKWPEFLSSDAAQCLYFEIARLCALINSPELEFLFAEQSLDTFSSLLKHFQREDFEVDDGVRKPTNVEALNLNLSALKEFLRLTNREVSSSLFANPWQDLLPKEDSLARFLKAEERSRFCVTFLDSSAALLENSCFFPLFTSRVLLDSENSGNFRRFSLEERKLVSGHLETVKKILERECFEVQRATSRENLDKILEEFERGLETLLDDLDRLKVSEEVGDVLALLEEVKWEKEPDSRMLRLGETLLAGAGALLEIFAEAPLVDPAVKSRVLAGYLSDDIDFFQTWRAVHKFHQEERTGQLPPPDLSHPYLTQALEIDSKTRVLLDATTKNIADRPEVPEYSAILRDLKLFLNSFASKAKLVQISSKIKCIFENPAPNRDEYLQAKTTAENWLAGFRNFQVKFCSHVWYWDIVGPILFVSSWASQGLTLMLQALSRKFDRPSRELVDSVQSLTNFPVSFGVQLDVTVLEKKLGLGRKLSKNLFLASLVNLGNQAEIQKGLTAEMVKEYHKISLAFARAWDAQEEEKRRKQEEEDALYIYKGKERKIDLTEEEQEQKDHQEMFPSFRMDFQDLMEVRELTDSVEMGARSESLKEDMELTLEDLALFYTTNSKILKFVKCAWMEARAPGGVPVYFVKPFMGRFQVGALGYEKLAQVLDWDDESDYALGARFALKQLEAEENREAELYDIYHDENIKEVQKLPPILAGLRKRVEELMREWPDHPSLKKIIVVIERLESFLLEAPLMKYLTGLELLLETCQEWERNAHAGVSIALHLAEITQVIVDWRKLELSYWKNLLEITAKREEDSGLKWWFFISSSIFEAVSNPEASTDSLLLALRQFMESSPLGQYQTRLSLLHQIHSYFIALEQFGTLENPIPKSIHSLLWNTLKFYEEFSPAIATRLSTLRAPIEKKLRDFVKICRWNDMNFSSLKDSVAKSQKMLGKSVREFKKVLAIPARTLLVSDDKLPLKGKTFFLKEESVQWYLNEDQEGKGLEGLERFLKSFGIKSISKVGGKMRELTEKAVRARVGKLGELLELLGELAEGAGEAAKDLQDIEVQEKGEKRKKFLHHVHSRRRLALADLFKNLTKLDLSYRKGMLKLQKSNSSFQDFSILPHNPSAGWKGLREQQGKKSKTKNSADDFLIKLYSSGTESAYQKSSIKVLAMLKAFQAPNKQLSVAIIERCKGFASDLMSKVVQEKTQIANFSDSLWNLRHLLQNNLNFTPDPEHLTQKLFRKSVELEFEFQQWRIFLEGAPPEYGALANSFLLRSSEVRGLLEPLQGSNAGLGVLKGAAEIFGKISADAKNFDLFAKKTLVSERLRKTFENLTEFLEKVETILRESSEETEIDGAVQILLAEEFSKLLTKIMLGFQHVEEFREKNQNSTENLLEEMRCLGVEKVLEDFENISAEFAKTQELLEGARNFAPILSQYLHLGQYYLTELIALHREHCQLLTLLSSLFTTLAQKGFNLPPDYEEEAEKEGSELDAKGGLGLGDGETTSDAKDVSDRIESEDQLEEALKPGESSAEGDKDLDENKEKGIEMPEDFEGKMQDEQKKDGEKKPEDEDSEEENDEPEHDKQMGDVEDPGADKLDEQLWGGSSDEEEENLDETNDTGGERQGQMEPELKAKDPRLEEQEEEEAPEDPQKEGPEKTQKEPKEPEDLDEANDDQIDPYHGDTAQPEIEPEDLELPEDLNLDDAEVGEKEQEEENPFDLDAAEGKEQEVPEDSEETVEKTPEEIENEQTEMEKQEEEAEEATPSGVNVEPMETEEPIIEEKNAGTESEKPEEDLQKELLEPPPEDLPEDGASEETLPKHEESTNEKDTVEASEEVKDQMDENVQGNQSQATEVQVTVEEHAPDQKDETGTGQAESTSGTGHEGTTAQKEEQHSAQEEREEKEASRKPGDTDRKRTLAAQEQAQAKRLKTVENPDQSEESASPEETLPEDRRNQADLYQHVSQGEKADATTMDNASEEDAQKQPPQSEKEGEEPPAMEEQEEDEPEVQVMEKETETVKGPPQDKPSKQMMEIEDEEEEEIGEPSKMEVEGETVASYSVERGKESSVHTLSELYSDLRRKEGASREEETGEEIVEVQDLTTRNEGTSAGALGKWHELENVTLPLAQELCEQLRLILEPTLAARLRGDYKTGKRLNMRKVIPYVASGFRKDKIWLRRTQPSKREYQILIALDDSASMSDNQSKQMAFSAVAVVAKSLSLLESGQLSVVSFGERIDLMHPFDEPFTDQSGAHLLEKFTFAQRQTRIAQLMSYVTKTLSDQKNSAGVSSSLEPEFAQLVLIISDGRNVSSEGKDSVARAIRKAREENIFMVFIIVDNPQNKDSILDVRYAEFDEKNNLKQVNFYMDHFPFPFYLILRDLTSLPTVLSDALRQWFELVTSSDR